MPGTETKPQSFRATERPEEAEPAVPAETPFPGKQKDTAQYIADMILELRNLAKAAKLFKVMVPLEFAYYESFSVANRVEVPPGEIRRIKALAEAARQAEAENQPR